MAAAAVVAFSLRHAGSLEIKLGLLCDIIRQYLYDESL
jgi:hypothetical protein